MLPLTMKQRPPNILFSTTSDRLDRIRRTRAARGADASKRRLASLLQELEPKLDSKARQELRVIQAQWERLRGKDCEWERGLFEGGSIAPTVYWSCVQARTQERIDRLKILLCEGAGMTGPCEASRKY